MAVRQWGTGPAEQQHLSNVPAWQSPQCVLSPVASVKSVGTPWGGEGGQDVWRALGRIHHFSHRQWLKSSAQCSAAHLANLRPPAELKPCMGQHFIVSHGFHMLLCVSWTAACQASALTPGHVGGLDAYGSICGAHSPICGEAFDTNRFTYDTIVGSLLYPACWSRLVIPYWYVRGVYFHYTAAPLLPHWRAATAVMRYLSAIRELGITFGGQLKLLVWCNEGY
jgi:hypothetical protein